MPNTMLLPIELTEAERLLVLTDLSAKLTDLEALEAEKSAIPERIKGLKAAINHLNHSIKTNTVERDVEIREEPNTFAGTVKIFRVDTGAWVKDRDMDPDERQLRLGDAAVPGGPVPDNVRDLRAEEQTAETPEEAEELRQQRLAAEEIERLAAEQAADDGAAPKRLLKAPRKPKIKITDERDKPLIESETNSVDTMPPTDDDGLVF